MSKKWRDPQIWTDFNNFIRRNRKRFLIRQHSIVIWMTGYSGAGKTTLAEALNKEILERGYFTKVFDGDIVRQGLNKDLGYSLKDRKENIRRIAEVSKLFLDTGLIVICSFISPTEESRALAKDIIGEDRFVELFVNCPLSICETRDPKGLYKMARQGLLKDFTGIDSIYEPPASPDIDVRTDLWDVRKSTRYAMKEILPRIRFKSKFRKHVLKNIK